MKQKLMVNLETDLKLPANVWKFGDDIDTDAIITGKYLTINKSEELAKHAFEGVRPEFARGVKEGDIIVACFNFGCGSSREHAPLALKGAKVKCILAKSFARIFFIAAVPALSTPSKMFFSCLYRNREWTRAIQTFRSHFQRGM